MSDLPSPLNASPLAGELGLATQPQNWQEVLLWVACRVSNSGLFTTVDDPALLALIFC